MSPRSTVSLCIKVALYRLNGALRNKFASYSINKPLACCGLGVVCAHVYVHEQPFALLPRSFSTVISEHWWPLYARAAHSGSWSPQCAGFNNNLLRHPPPPTPPPQRRRSCCHLYCHSPLMAMSTRTQSPFPFWRFSAICTETLIPKVINAWARGSYASGFWVHYLEILWTVNKFQFYGLAINEQPAGLRHDAN